MIRKKKFLSDFCYPVHPIACRELGMLRLRPDVLQKEYPKQRSSSFITAHIKTSQIEVGPGNIIRPRPATEERSKHECFCAPTSNSVLDTSRFYSY